MRCWRGLGVWMPSRRQSLKRLPAAMGLFRKIPTYQLSESSLAQPEQQADKLGRREK